MKTISTCSSNDIPDQGQNATPANDRRYTNNELASVFDKTEAIAKVMDELGYDTLWLAEHHFQHEGYECLPNILMLAVRQQILFAQGQALRDTP